VTGPAQTAKGGWTFAGWRFAPEHGGLREPDGSAVELTRQEERLLALFLQAAGRTLSRDFLLEALSDAGKDVYDRAVDTLVSRLRQKLGDDARQPRLIVTQHGRGYSFAAPVRKLPGDAGIPAAAPSEVECPTIAVWPFRNLSSENRLDHLAAGLTDEILVALARSQSFTVIGRSAAYAYGAGKDTDFDRAKRELAARYIVEGSLRKRGQDVRVTVRLTEQETGRHLWAENFDRPMDQLLAVQEEVTDSIISTLQPRLIRAEALRVRGMAAEHLDAWSLFVRGMVAFYSFRRSGVQEASDLAREAIARRPDFANAYALLSVAIRVLVANGGDGDPAELNAQSLAAGRRAVELDPDHTYTLGSLGSALVYTGRARDGIPYLERAIEIDPTYCPTVATLAVALVYCGQAEEAAACAERAVKLSRNDPVAGHYSWFCLANAELMRGRAEAAETAIRRALALNPGYVWSHVLLGNLLGLQGDTAGAQGAIADAAQLFGGVEKLIDIYRTLHLTRFERTEHAARMAAGLTAAGFRGLVLRRPQRAKSGGRRSVSSRR
jgi:TolB-like protein/Tfp pilus assembly protein PilF